MIIMKVAMLYMISLAKQVKQVKALVAEMFRLWI